MNKEGWVMYTNVNLYGNKILVRGVDLEGKRYNEKVDYKPTLFVENSSNKPTKWKTMSGARVHEIQPGSIKECNEFFEKYKDVEGFNVYGPTGYQYQYLAERFPKEIKFDTKNIRVAIIDIETTVENSFPDKANPEEVILLISIKEMWNNRIITFGFKPYNGEDKSFEYRKSTNEAQMFKDFLDYWQRCYPDVISGWNSNLFDIPYLYNRIVKVLGEEYANKLSPWDIVKVKDVRLASGTEIRCEIFGVSHLDYLDMYKKFAYTSQESYKLDHVAEQEVGRKKVKLPGSSFRDAYTDHWDTFVYYNAIDSELVALIDNKLKLFDLIFASAYDAKITFEDVFSPVKTWDNIIYLYLKEQGIVIPNKRGNKSEAFVGGYVKEPLVGKHRWIASYDLNSLYPHLIMQYNMSPETIVSDRLDVTIEKALNNNIDISDAITNNYAVAANGCMFKKDFKGLLPTLMQLYYDRRVIYKKEMLKCKQEYEIINEELKRRNL